MCCGSVLEELSNLDKPKCDRCLKAYSYLFCFWFQNHVFHMLKTKEFSQASLKLQTHTALLISALINREQRYLNITKFFNIGIIF